jgi:hypothetical protein
VEADFRHDSWGNPAISGGTRGRSIREAIARAKESTDGRNPTDPS